METDIYQKLEADFGNCFEEARDQIDMLDAETKGLIDNRILRAIIYLASGNIEQMKSMIELARKDYRDVLWQAEYDCGEELLRDFNKTFHDLGLMKKKSK